MRSASLSSESFASGGGLSGFPFSTGDFSLVFCPEGRSRATPDLSSGVAKSSLFPRILVVANIFLNSSSATALAGALAADTFAAGVWRSVPLPPLKGVCNLSASLVDMSD
ncbi:hypothetical protein F2Q68_00032590 [Brassica cretica]|uniref:Uncharacterized protein n=1 Tax=Brassica cretica TaxID=69181 RepID=A0A8S9G7T5_BRACR|nr:hypothetical protein F2Q68_00032590 [Brassica cretica]